MTSDAPSPWGDGGLRLFMSHTSAHKALVSKVKASLAEWGIASFVAHEDIDPTAEWIEVIETALSTCDALVAFITEDFHASRWTNQEVGWAYGRRVPVLSIRLGADPYGFLGRFQAVRGTVEPGGAPDVEARQIVEQLVRDPRSEPKVSAGIVSSFCSSNSFAMTRSLWPLLEGVKRWTPELIAQVEEACRSNSQIREAGLRPRQSVPDAVRDLIARVRGVSAEGD